ncbi:hypothetical protein [Caballeronia zhejiangensis]|uniref:hypothetical protein n=1 Tax=Caballeronia zhejiangensis TaxID=871203 RepID=UPI00074B462D|nr:hypothetical protein [Caballeronia zhejiangensis]SAL77700.1 transmembrane transport protein [Caballeronia peredens]
MGVTTVSYTGQTYSLFFLTQTLHLDIGTASFLSGTALLMCLPIMWTAAAILDRIGRKKVILTGCLLFALTSFPIFHSITHFANPALESATVPNRVTVRAAAGECRFQINLLGNTPPVGECDKIKEALARAGVPYLNITDESTSVPSVQIGQKFLQGYDAQALQSAIRAAGYAQKADPAQVNKPMVVVMLLILCTYFAMVYSPLAAALVSMFPVRVRYTALSFPYHLGNGIFGGFFAAVAFAMVTATGDIYFGIWYPVVFAALTRIVGALFLREHAQQEESPTTSTRAAVKN